MRRPARAPRSSRPTRGRRTGPDVLAAEAATEEPSAERSRAAQPFDPTSLTLRTVLVIDGLDEPVTVTGDGTGSGLLYVVERSGVVQVIDPTGPAAGPAPRHHRQGQHRRRARACTPSPSTPTTRRTGASSSTTTTSTATRSSRSTGPGAAARRRGQGPHPPGGRAAVHQQQGRADLLRSRRLPLHRPRRRRGLLSGRPDGLRPAEGLAARQGPAHRRGWRPPLRDPEGQPVRLAQEAQGLRAARRGPMACATRAEPRSIPRPATSGSAMPARTASRRSTSLPTDRAA